MGLSSFKELFGEYMPGDVSETLLNSQIENCRISSEPSRELSLEITAPEYITAAEINKAEAALKTALALSGIKFKQNNTKESFCSIAAKDIADAVCRKNVIFNGYFAAADYTINGNELTVTLKSGGINIIKDADFEGKFKKVCLEQFGFAPEIKFAGQLEQVDIPVAEDVPAARVKHESHEFFSTPADISASEKIDTSIPPADGLPVYLQSAEVFYGRKIVKTVKKLSEITPPSSPDETVFISAWGEAFGVDMRDITTKRGEKKIRVNFSFSDGTNSFSATLFTDADKKQSVKPLKDGAVLLVNGNYKFDTWRGDYVVDVKTMATLKKYEPVDTYNGEKRIELHCHTNMSAKDAVSSAGAIIKQAYKWGHKAIAITDHGVVQAYPEAASAVADIKKSGGEFKVIYGVESYFADDTLGETDYKKLDRYHQIILVKNLVGLKNLYKIVSSAHLNSFYKRPLSLRSVIDANREGLILGSACEQGELYKAIVAGKPHEELVRIAKYYDYLEIQPLGNNAFMVRESAMQRFDKKGQLKENPFKNVTDLEVIKGFNRKVVEIADELGLPVVATGDVHFLNKEDSIIRKILMAGQGYDDFDNQAPLYLKTTDEMLDDFSYFGDRAKEFVIDNPQKIAAMISDEVIPVPKGNYPPVIEGSDDLLKEICWNRAMSTYGYQGKIPELVKNRLEKELTSIIGNGYSIMYISAQKLVAFSEEHGYLVGSRGSVGSSFAATMAGISEVNPLPPHYCCPKCKFTEFFVNNEVGSGFDLPDKNCPKCGTPYNRDGHNIPFETFLGFEGDKVPDIDLNFSDEFQTNVQKYTESLFGAGNVYKAGTISTVAEKTAYGFAKAYAEKKNIVLSNAELNRLASKVEKAKIKTTTGQHPAGMIVVPRDKEICDFCPVQHPADDTESDVVTTHFDFHSIHDTILKLDELGHVVPTTYKYLEEYSGIPVTDVTMSDEKVYSLFLSPAALGLKPEDIDGCATGTLCLPEFGTRLTRDMLIDCKPKNFADLLQISGLSHGTGVYHGNAKDLIDNGTCTISEVIGTRDNIMVYLMSMGMDGKRAFKITETVRKGMVAKGKISKEDWEKMAEDMRRCNVPEWYIESCRKIEYMFPKAHAAAYVISALRIGWYKVYKPIEFYCAYFTARPDDVDVPTVLKGRQAVLSYISNVKAKGKEAPKKELDVLGTMLIFNEMMARGFEVLPIDLQKSHAVRYLPENGKMRLPFGALAGVGEKAAYALYEAAQKGDFISKDEFQVAAGVSKTVVQSLADLGVLNDLPDTNQISMF